MVTNILLLEDVMEKDRAIVLFCITRKDGKKEEKDLDIPLSITGNELIVALNETYQLGIDTEDVKNCYLSSEYPTTLIRGNKLLREYNLMNGTKISYSERKADGQKI